MVTVVDTVVAIAQRLGIEISLWISVRSAYFEPASSKLFKNRSPCAISGYRFFLEFKVCLITSEKIGSTNGRMTPVWRSLVRTSTKSFLTGW